MTTMRSTQNYFNQTERETIQYFSKIVTCLSQKICEMVKNCPQYMMMGGKSIFVNLNFKI